MVTYGIDVASWQRGIDMGRVAREGFSFAVVKVTEGTGYVNPEARAQIDGALNAGLLVAQYHFLNRENVDAQVSHILRNCRKDLPIAIDFEHDPQNGSLPLWGQATEMRDKLKSSFPSVGIYTNEADWKKAGSVSLESWDWVWKAKYAYNEGGFASVVYERAPDWGWNPFGGRTPDVWQFTDKATCAGMSVDGNAYKGSAAQLKALWHCTRPTSPTPRPAPADTRPSGEVVLPYSRANVTQETYYWCGPASSQTVILSKTGRLVAEAELARKLTTTVNGTDYIGYFPRVLNEYLPGANYEHRNMPNDPPSGAQVEQLWADVTNSINGGWGVVANIVAPPSNYPRAVAPSTQSPAYGGGTVYHYIALMGYAGAGNNRRIWIADSGFSPYGYWISLAQLASLIPPKGYAYATTKTTKQTGGLTLSDIDQKRITENLNQQVGPQKTKDGMPTYEGWNVRAVYDAAKKKQFASLTQTEMLACLIIDNQTQRAQLEALAQASKANTEAINALAQAISVQGGK